MDFRAGKQLVSRCGEGDVNVNDDRDSDAVGPDWDEYTGCVLRRGCLLDRQDGAQRLEGRQISFILGYCSHEETQGEPLRRF